MASANNNARRIRVRASCGQSTIMTSEPARERLLWAIIFLVLPVTFGNTTTCRSPALAFSAAIHFAMKRSAPWSSVLSHSPLCYRLQSSTGRHWYRKIWGRSGDIPSTLFPAPHATRAPHQFSEHDALRQSRILHAYRKSREQDPPSSHNRLDASTFRLHERV